MKFIEDITNFIFLSDNPENVDMIFIPGGSYAEIAETAASIWNKGYSPFILPSGKYGAIRGYFPGPLSKSDIYSETYATEWDFLKDVLMKNGVDETAILMENEAVNTYENAVFSRKVTDNLNLNIKKAIICCKSFHARRCLMYYQLLYPETEFIICPTDTQNVNKETWFKSDEGIEKVLGELSRSGYQFIDILKTLKNK